MLAHSHLRQTSSGPESSHRCPRQGCRTPHPPSCWAENDYFWCCSSSFPSQRYVLCTLSTVQFVFINLRILILPQNVLGSLTVVIISCSCDFSSRFCVISLKGGLRRAVIEVIVCAVCRLLWGIGRWWQSVWIRWLHMLSWATRAWWWWWGWGRPWPLKCWRWWWTSSNLCLWWTWLLDWLSLAWLRRSLWLQLRLDFSFLLVQVGQNSLRLADLVETGFWWSEVSFQFLH